MEKLPKNFKINFQKPAKKLQKKKLVEELPEELIKELLAKLPVELLAELPEKHLFIFSSAQNSTVTAMIFMGLTVGQRFSSISTRGALFIMKLMCEAPIYRRNSV